MAMTDLLDGNATLISDVSSDYQTRKENGLCTYPGCTRPPGEATLLCPRHAHQAKKRAAEAMAKRRAANRAMKRCADCGVTSKTYRCPACRIAVDRGKTGRVNNGDNKSKRLAARTAVDATGRVRYHGQARTGPLSKAAADEHDLAAAKKCIDRAIEGLALARSPEVQQLPRIQREEAKRAALSQADHGAAFLGEVFVRNRYDAVNLVLRERDDED